MNSNPATIMTDPNMADATYIEPITPAVVAKILERERPDALLPTMGGQTALNCALALDADGTLERLGIELIGAKADVIDKAEDRQKFKVCMEELGLESAISRTVGTMEEARAAIEITGLPAIIRPSFTLAGTGGGIAYNREEFETIVREGLDISPVHEVLIEESLLGWKEFEMEVVRDKNDNCIIVCAIENIDPNGRPYRRLHYRRPGPDPDRQRIPDYARCQPESAAWYRRRKPADRTSSLPFILIPVA